MNKLDVAVELIYRQAGINKVNVKKAFDLADEIEKEAIKRRLHFPEICPVCKESIHVQNMSTLDKSYYRIKCRCADIRGTDIQSVIDSWLDWWDKTND